MKSSPVKTIILFFIALILAGTALLCLPFARHDNAVFSFINCLFTATSAVCVTGLSVVDIGTYFNTYGQIIILALVQIGGLGYMLVSTGIGLILGKMALKDRQIMQEIFDISSFDELFKLLKKAVFVVLFIELIGAAIFTFSFAKTYSIAKSIYLGIFYSITSFCNAGFSVFGNSLENFSQTPLVLYTSVVLIILGGLGFFVLVDIIDKFIRKNVRLTFHSKVILWMTFGLIVFAFVSFFCAEYFTLIKEHSLSYVINNSLFQAVSARTAGFNSVPVNIMTSFSTFVIIILMFIGGGPGSTAGGIKITTLTLVFVFIRSTLKGDEEFPLAKKNMDEDLIKKALLVFVLMLFFVTVFILLLLYTQKQLDPVKIIFEAVSGFCTVGLSLGITSQFDLTGKLILIVAMLVGRIGAITILVYLMNTKFIPRNIKYPEGKLLIG